MSYFSHLGERKLMLKEVRLLDQHLSGFWKWEWKLLSCVQLFVTSWNDETVHEIFQARILEWVAFPFSRGSSQPRDQIQVSHIAGRLFTNWATQEAHQGSNPSFLIPNLIVPLHHTNLLHKALREGHFISRKWTESKN